MFQPARILREGLRLLLSGRYVAWYKRTAGPTVERFCGVECLEQRVLLSSILMVDTAMDVVDPNDNRLSLRESLIQAELQPGPDVIRFDSSLDGAVIRLDRSIGELEVTSDLTIEGLGGDRLVVYADAYGQQPCRVFSIQPGLNVNLVGLTLSGGYINGDGGGIYSRADYLRLDDVIINSCFSTQRGGGVYQQGGEIEVTNSYIGYNQVGELPFIDSAGGGGLYVDGGSATVINSRISGNTVNAMIASYGGGIYIRGGTLILSASTIDHNTITTEFMAGSRYGYGAGLFANVSADVTISNSTISTNRNESKLGSGGGIFAGGELLMVNNTVTGNLSPWQHGGIDCYHAVLHNNIVAGNYHWNPYYPLAYEPDDFSGGQVDSSHNLIGAYGSGSLLSGANGNLLGTTRSPIKPLLGPLADNGGPTHTHMLLAGSPAIDAGSDSAAHDADLSIDQRGLDRFVRQVDMGSVEISDDVVGPSAVVASAGDGEVVLEWDEVIENTVYNVIYRCNSLDGEYQAVTVTVGADHVIDSNVTNGNTYYYYVTSVVSDGGQSDFSAVVSANPSEGPIAAVTVQSAPENQIIAASTQQGFEQDLPIPEEAPVKIDPSEISVRFNSHSHRHANQETIMQSSPAKSIKWTMLTSGRPLRSISGFDEVDSGLEFVWRLKPGFQTFLRIKLEGIGILGE